MPSAVILMGMRLSLEESSRAKPQRVRAAQLLQLEQSPEHPVFPFEQLPSRRMPSAVTFMGMRLSLEESSRAKPQRVRAAQLLQLEQSPEHPVFPFEQLPSRRMPSAVTFMGMRLSLEESSRAKP